MPINPDCVGATSSPTESSWMSKDSIIYALGVGAGVADLAFTTENSMNVDQQALPTMGVVLADVSGVFAEIGSFNPAMLVHGEQRIEAHRTLGVAGRISTVAEITGIFDKGKGAVIEVTARSTDASDGEPLFDTTMSVFIRGEGGWGGDRGPSGDAHAPPESEPDGRVTYSTREDQALIYRLSGDRNPLHSDPSFAQMAGFDRPILHGLCTYGFTGRAILAEVCGGDIDRFGSIAGRFSSPVFPGEDLTIEMWNTGDGALFRTKGGDGRVVIDNGVAATR